MDNQDVTTPPGFEPMNRSAAASPAPQGFVPADAWKQKLREDDATVNAALDAHIKEGERIIARTLQHLYRASGPGGISPAPTDADGFSREDYRRLAESIQKNGLGAVHKLY